MGNLIARLQRAFEGLKDKKILLVGLDAAGKTTVLYKFKMGETITTIPTIGFNVETLDIPKYNLRFTVWDIGGQDKVRRLWKHYFLNTDAVIFVVDSADRERISEAREELHKILNDTEVRAGLKSLLVFANKQDLPQAMPCGEICEKLGLPAFSSGFAWHVQSTIATTGDGLHEGLNWLSCSMTKK